MSKEDLLAFGGRLRAARELRGMMQADLGAAADIPPNRISNYELGYAYPQARSLIALCKVLDCSADYLLGLDDHRVHLTADELWCNEHYRNLDDDQRAAIRNMIATLERSRPADG